MTKYVLPLTPFEESLLGDDQPAYPWNILQRLRLDGAVDRGRFEQAVLIAWQRHVLLRSRVRRTWLGRYVWESYEATAALLATRLHWNQHEPGRWPRLRRLDLAVGESWEMYVAADGAATEILLHVHHAAVDGLGLTQFVGDLLTAYDALATGVAPASRLAPCEPERLRQRKFYGYSRLEILRLVPKLARGLAGIRQFLGRRPVPLVEHVPADRNATLPDAYPGVQSYTCSVAATNALRARAHSLDVTLNDLLLRDLFIALGAVGTWRQARDGDWLRIAVPYGMRRSSESDMPAANLVSLVFLDRRAADLVDAELLLAGIRDEMSLIKGCHLGLIYLLSLWATGLVPGLLGRVTRKQKFSSTASFSNIKQTFSSSTLPHDGAQIVAGGRRLESVETFGPLRPGMCVALLVATYADRLTIGLHADLRFITAAQADDLLQRYAARITAE